MADEFAEGCVSTRARRVPCQLPGPGRTVPGRQQGWTPPVPSTAAAGWSRGGRLPLGAQAAAAPGGSRLKEGGCEQGSRAELAREKGT